MKAPNHPVAQSFPISIIQTAFIFSPCHSPFLFLVNTIPVVPASAASMSTIHAPSAFSSPVLTPFFEEPPLSPESEPPPLSAVFLS
jgi:hypothetical protein